MASSALRSAASHLKTELARRRWRRTSPAALDWRKLILAVAMATTALAVLFVGTIPHHPAMSFPSASISYATDQDATGAAPPPHALPLLLLPTPPASLVSNPRRSPAPLEASVLSLSSPDPAISSPRNSTPVENFTPEGRVGRGRSSVRSSRPSRSGGPYITTAHDELRRNSIKALCNADTSEGIFIRGKDVSLPETIIRTLRRPLKDLGGKPISQRPILAFYAGQMHGRVRPTLLRYWGGKDEDMKIYGPLPARVSRVMSYIQHMKSSKFCICPMGYEVNSPRIVEAIHYECVPVIIADNFVPPFDEVLDWSSFSVIVAENDIPDLKNILQQISPRHYIYMQSNVKRLQKHFLWHAKPVKYDLFHMILHSIWFSRLNQIQMQH